MSIKIIALGDSLTAGYGVGLSQAYPALLERKLYEAGYDCRIENWGISGEISAETLARLPEVILEKPDLVILETGANDGLRGLDVVAMAENIGSTIEKLQRSGVVVVLAGMELGSRASGSYSGDFSAVYPRLAAQYQTPYMPFFLADIAGREEYNQEDGIHPTANGYTIIVENIFSFVVKGIEQVGQ